MFSTTAALYILYSCGCSWDGLFLPLRLRGGDGLNKSLKQFLKNNETVRQSEALSPMPFESVAVINQNMIN